MKLCLIENCVREAKSRGLCFGHYSTHRTKGTLDDVALPSQNESKHSISEVDPVTKLGSCSVCGGNSPVALKNKDSTVWRCLTKRRADDRERHKTNPKKSWMVYRFGDGDKIPAAEAKDARDRFYVEQEGRCAVCKRTEDEVGSTLHLDHCHATGKLRGLLCADCNRGLGSFRDSPENLIAASEYLTR